MKFSFLKKSLGEVYLDFFLNELEKHLEKSKSGIIMSYGGFHFCPHLQQVWALHKACSEFQNFHFFPGAKIVPPFLEVAWISCFASLKTLKKRGFHFLQA